MFTLETKSQIAPVASTEKLAHQPRATPAVNGATALVCNGEPPLTEVERRYRYLLEGHIAATWPLERLLELCREWNAGTSLSAIGAIWGVGKNPVAGKTHRLVKAGILLPRGKLNGGWSRGRQARDPADGAAALARASAVTPHAERAAAAAPPPDNPLPAPAVPPPRFVRVTPAQVGPKPRGCGAGTRRAGAYAPPPLPSIAAQALPAAAPRFGRVTECCWPLGHPGTRAFHFCDAPSEPGRPYCEAHVRKAYVTVGGHAQSVAAEAHS